MRVSSLSTHMPVWIGIAVLTLTTAAHSEMERGKPGTQERKNWCAEQRGHCEDDGYQNCREKYGDSKEYDQCSSSVYDTCRISLGPDSRCQTDD